MPYIDGFVAAVPSDRKEDFIAFSHKVFPIMKEFGVLKAIDCWGDDVPEGEVTSFPMAVKCEKGETVVFSWQIWPDKATRDVGMAKMREDPRFQSDDMVMPFDGKRLIYGGFDMIVDL